MNVQPIYTVYTYITININPSNLKCTNAGPHIHSVYTQYDTLAFHAEMEIPYMTLKKAHNHAFSETCLYLESEHNTYCVFFVFLQDLSIPRSEYTDR